MLQRRPETPQPHVPPAPKLDFRPVENPQQARETLSYDVLSKITNNEFLAVSRDNRLEHITKPPVQADRLQS